MRNSCFKQRKHIILIGIALTICIIYFVIIEDVDIKGWERGVDRRLGSYIKRYGGGDGWGLNTKKVCPSSRKVMIAVNSAAPNIELRAAIRNSWGAESVTSNKAQVVFVVGQVQDPRLQRMLEVENGVSEDMVQGDFLDSYNNLTLKSVWTIKWYLKECNDSTQFLVKMDDDVFLHLPKLLRRLETINPRGVLRGILYQHPYVIRNRFDKWYCPRYLYNESYYPDFLSGITYLMSRDAAQRIYQVAFDVPLLHLEDVYITGLCGARAGLKRKALEGLTPESHLKMRCDIDLISLHKQSPEQIMDNWFIVRDCPG